MRGPLPRRLKPPVVNRRLFLLGVALVIAVYRYYFVPAMSEPSAGGDPGLLAAPVNAPANACGDWPGCFTGTIAHITDGDTLDVVAEGARRRVRLVLVDAPERDTPDGPAATQQLASLCRIESVATVFPDTSQPRDEYGRTLGVVHCGGRNANAEMIRSGRAKLYRRFCRASAFGGTDWARELGCRQ